MTDPGRLSGRQPQAIRSALLVLSVVGRTGPGTTVKQVCAELGLPQATAYRIVSLLVAEEYLVRLPDLRGLALGVRMGELLPDHPDRSADLPRSYAPTVTHHTRGER